MEGAIKFVDDDRQTLALTGPARHASVARLPWGAWRGLSTEVEMSPNPTALRSALKDEEVDEHRCVSCVEYDDCLDAALRHSWRSWSCGRCDLFPPARRL